jgi:hypothetical protein
MDRQFDTDGFDLHAHRRYIEQGGCPYVEGKTWCNGRSDDLHQNHWAKLVESNGDTRRVAFLTWRKRP